ncbi:unnamed protein product [Prorocentrum cordatum]|uniref:Uncharacterized protein n=1 Tax=Prorocentrum cordatum TaxID=2364126 RepID=A0ABN9PG30_9DINO|nr:unnamed protein product [Polarella glacialis]
MVITSPNSIAAHVLTSRPRPWQSGAVQDLPAEQLDVGAPKDRGSAAVAPFSCGAAGHAAQRGAPRLGPGAQPTAARQRQPRARRRLLGAPPPPRAAGGHASPGRAPGTLFFGLRVESEPLQG